MLTDQQIESAFQSAADADEDTHIRFARKIEALAREQMREECLELVVRDVNLQSKSIGGTACYIVLAQVAAAIRALRAKP